MDAASSASVNRVSYGERRRVPREKVSTVTYVKVDDRNGGILLTLGTGGLSIQAVARLDPEQDLVFRFKFFDTGETITAVGRATWLGPTHKNAGVRFKDLPEETERSIANWIARQQNGAPAAKAKPFSPTWQAVEKVQSFPSGAAGFEVSDSVASNAASTLPQGRPGTDVQEIRSKPFPLPKPAHETQYVPSSPSSPISEANFSAEPAATEPYRVPSRAILGDAPYLGQPQDASTTESAAATAKETAPAPPAVHGAAPATLNAPEIAKHEAPSFSAPVTPTIKPIAPSLATPAPAEASANAPFRPLSLKDILAQQEQPAGASPATVPLEPWRRILHPEAVEAPQTHQGRGSFDFAQPRVTPPAPSTLFGVAQDSVVAEPKAAAPSARREILILLSLVVCMAVGSIMVVESGTLKRPVKTVSSAQAPAPAASAAAAGDPAAAIDQSTAAVPPRVVRRPAQDSWLADIQRLLPGMDDREPLLPSMINVPVKTDQQSGYYYCLDSPIPGQPLATSLEMQGQALQDGYQPKLGAYCH
jgi:hypothetical protein